MTERLRRLPDTPPLTHSEEWEAFLREVIEARRLKFPAPEILCDRTHEELSALKQEGRMWVPETGLTLLQLGKMFPNMKSSAVTTPGKIEDGEPQQGCRGVDVETSIDSPQLSVKKVKEGGVIKLFFDGQEGYGMRLSIYILASQLWRRITGHYFDENGTSSLLCSREREYAVGACFDRSGKLSVSFVSGPNFPTRKISGLGVRSERIKNQGVVPLGNDLMG